MYWHASLHIHTYFRYPLVGRGETKESVRREEWVREEEWIVAIRIFFSF